MVQFDSDAAFPSVSHGGVHEHQYVAFGLSKRELFAAMALHGLIASNDSEAGDRIDELPKYAVQIAEALLVALGERAHE